MHRKGNNDDPLTRPTQRLVLRDEKPVFIRTRLVPGAARLIETPVPTAHTARAFDTGGQTQLESPARVSETLAGGGWPPGP